MVLREGHPFSRQRKCCRLVIQSLRVSTLRATTSEMGDKINVSEKARELKSLG